MTRLEEEIFFAIIDFDGIDDGEKAKAAAEITKKYAKAAWYEARSKGFNGSAYYSDFDDYAKANGIIE